MIFLIAILGLIGIGILVNLPPKAKPPPLPFEVLKAFYDPHLKQLVLWVQYPDGRKEMVYRK